MKLKSIIIIFLFLIPFSGICNENYFIKINRNTIVIGEYIGVYHKPKIIEKFLKNEYNFNTLERVFNLNDKSSVLFYFHGLQANNVHTQKKSIKGLTKIYNIEKTISIIWKSKSWIYKKAWTKSLNQGKEFYPIINQIINTQNNYSVLCHSMGHKIFEGVIDADSLIDDKKFNKIFFVAADLDIDVFEKNFKSLNTHCKHLFIYANRKDLILAMSKKMHKKDRLGRDVFKYKEGFSSLNNVSIIDVTNSSTNKKDKFTRHSYILKDPQVIESINRYILLNDIKSNYIELK